MGIDAPYLDKTYLVIGAKIHFELLKVYYIPQESSILFDDI